MIRNRNLLAVLLLMLPGLLSLSCRRGSSGPQPIEGVYHSDQVGDLEILKDGTFTQNVDGVTLHGKWWVENNSVNFLNICVLSPATHSKTIGPFSTDLPDSNGHLWIFEDMDWCFTRVRNLPS